MTRIFGVLAAILLATSAGAASTTSMNVDITVTHAGSPVQTLIPVIQPAGTVFQFVASSATHHYQKLFSAIAANSVMRPNRILKTFGHLLQHLVASQMPIPIVDLFEMVYITK